jgi:aldose 1-epimerase
VLPPSGRQFRIQYGNQVAIAVEAGGGLRAYEVGGRPILAGYANDEPVNASRGLPLVPWPNRIADGEYTFEGNLHHLPIDERARHTAIHGLTRWAAWQVVTHSPSDVTLGTTIFPRPGYPFTVGVEILYRLTVNGLSVETTARNLGRGRLPYGAGHHPYFAPLAGRIDTSLLEVPADSYLAADERGLPLDEQPVAGTPYDFRTARMIGQLPLATTYSRLVRNQDGLARVWFDDLCIWLDTSYPYVLLFSGEDLPDHTVHRRALAVEPMTCPSNAFRNTIGLVVLEPGQAHVARWGVDVKRLSL